MTKQIKLIGGMFDNHIVTVTELVVEECFIYDQKKGNIKSKYVKQECGNYYFKEFIK